VGGREARRRRHEQREREREREEAESGGGERERLDGGSAGSTLGLHRHKLLPVLLRHVG